MPPFAAASPSASLDSEGRLLAADARLLDLVEGAGGAIGAPLPFAGLAGVARLVQRLGTGLSRTVPVADGDDDLSLRVRAEPGQDGVALFVDSWSDAPRATSDGTEDRDFADALPGLAWETDAGLRLTHLAAGLRGDDDAPPLGSPLATVFALEEDAAGNLPILTSVATGIPFRDQHARLRATGRLVTLAGTPRFDRAGRFAGLSGRADVLDDRAVTDDPLFRDGFGSHLDRALRRPIERIIANAGSMSAELDGPLSESYADYADDIVQAGRHLLGLVDDLVDLESVEQPGFAIPVEPVDLADIARRAAGLLSVRASDGGVTIARPAIEAVLSAQGSFRRTLQIVVNLIANAVRYAPRGSVVRVIVAEGDRHATVTVADDGPGIAATDHARIFDKFGRIDPDEPGGSGLGLYISRRLARAMGGDVTVESAPGEGARFTLSLPR